MPFWASDQHLIVRSPVQNDSTGSGLGLSIAKWIAEVHDGTIQVKSREKHGSTFIVSLPLSPQ